MFSSQQWVLDKQDIQRFRQQDLKALTEEEYQKIMIFFANCEYILYIHISSYYIFISHIIHDACNRLFIFNVQCLLTVCNKDLMKTELNTCCFFIPVIQALGEQLKVRQQVIATATVYFKRFYSR